MCGYSLHKGLRDLSAAIGVPTDHHLAGCYWEVVSNRKYGNGFAFLGATRYLVDDSFADNLAKRVPDDTMQSVLELSPQVVFEFCRMCQFPPIMIVLRCSAALSFARLVTV